jgi:serine/threonine protein kinase
MHREIKPENVLVCKPPDSLFVEYKVSDLGLARPAENEIENCGDGTAEYRPSERFWGLSSYTYSVGRLFLACRSGQPPVPGTYEQLRASGVYDNLPDPMREIEWDFLSVCLREHGSDSARPGTLCLYTKYFHDML